MTNNILGREENTPSFQDLKNEVGRSEPVAEATGYTMFPLQGYEHQLAQKKIFMLFNANFIY